MLQGKDYLEIDIEGRKGIVKLFIYPQTSNAKLFEDNEQLYGKAKYQLVEGNTYVYEFSDPNGLTSLQFSKEDEIVTFHPNRKTHKSEGTFKTGIHVGQLSLIIIDKNTDEEYSKLRLEIQSTKVDYDKDYQLMLDEIAEYYTDLVLQQGSPVTQHLEVDENCSPETLYQRFSFVHSIIDSEAFSEAIHKIITSPIRKWTDANIQRDITAIRRLSRKNIRQMASDPDRIPLSHPMRNGLCSVPRSLEVEYKKDTTDNIENQFVKFVLHFFSSFCSDISKLSNASERLKEEAYYTIERISSYLESQFFRKISMPTHLNMNSPVLQRKEGYREVLQAWLLFDLAAKLNWTGGDDIYEAGKKNVATLYEYWLFFKLLELVSEFFNISPEEKANLVTSDPDHINLNIVQGKTQMIRGQQETYSRLLNVAFYYNRTFNKVSEKDDPIHKAGSWTMTMRPDYTLSLWPGNISEEEAERQELIVHIHFDAKYRLNKIMLEDSDTGTDTDSELKEEKKQQELNIYKRGDLLKMHAYKDAIRRTSGAYVLYPGEENRELRGFHEIIPGLGAFRVRPAYWQEDSLYLKQFLAEVKAHLLDRTSDREKLSYFDYKIHKDNKSSMVMESLPESEGRNRGFLPDETYVLLGYFRDKVHLKWIQDHHLYNSRAGVRKGTVAVSPEIATAKYILLHDSYGDAYLYKLLSGGPMVYAYEDMKASSYPYDPAQKKEDQKKTYLVFQLSKRDIEPEFLKYKWNPHDIPQLHGKNATRLTAIKLTELMKFAKKTR